jgi:Coenzyme PQQ synthesis protein D (PqqD)
MFKKAIPKNYLALVPIRKIEEFNETDGKITLLLPKFRNKNLEHWLIPRKKSVHFKIHLDELGSQVWWLIDGNRTVASICSLLNDFLLNQNKPNTQLDERVTRFLTDLYKNDFICFNEAQLQSGE